MDVYGQALIDYYEHKPPASLWIHNSYGEPEQMPVEVFFRNERDMPDMEILALEACRGKVLDIGAGAGSHSLFLQERGLDVTSLEISKGACEVMRKRGLRKVLNQNIFGYQDDTYDTLLLLMNGIGLCGTLDKLAVLLEHFKVLLKPGGQVIFDSSDIMYLYEKDDLLPAHYYGEIAFQYEYKNRKGEWFNWLYVDFQTLEKVAGSGGWKTDFLHEDDHDQFLVRLSLDNS